MKPSYGSRTQDNLAGITLAPKHVWKSRSFQIPIYIIIIIDSRPKSFLSGSIGAKPLPSQYIISLSISKRSRLRLLATEGTTAYRDDQLFPSEIIEK